MTRAPSEASRAVIPIRPRSNDIVSDSTSNIVRVEDENENKILGTGVTLGPDWNWQPEADAIDGDEDLADRVILQGEDTEVLQSEEEKAESVRLQGE